MNSKPLEQANNDKNTVRGKHIIIICAALLALIFVVGSAFGVRQLRLTRVRGQLPKGEIKTFDRVVEGEIEQYLCTALNLASDRKKTKLDVTTKLDIPKDSVHVASEDAAVLDAIEKLRTEIIGNLEPYYQDYQGKFGEDFSYLLPELRLSGDMLKKQSFLNGNYGDVLYSLPDSETAEKMLSDGTVRELGSYATLELIPYERDFFEALDSKIFTSFNMAVGEDIVTDIGERVGDVFTIDDFSLSCTDFSMVAGVDYLEDKLDYITCNRGYSLSLDVTFAGDYASLGSTSLSLKYFARQLYDFTWAGVEFKDKVVWLKKGQTFTPELTLSCDKKPKLKWTVTEGDFVSVDKDGTLHAEDTSTSPCLVTVKMKYKGHTYRDSYKVYSRVPVRRAKMNISKKTVPTGSLVSLEPVLYPKNATVQKVYWFSDNRAVATVDDNGNVTAKSEGVASIYFITLDGSFKGVCQVTVT